MKSFNGITACVLAGGMSRRFGEDKSLYFFNGRRLIEHVIDTLRKIFDEVMIIAGEADKYSFLGIPVFPDIFPGIGPIGGLHSALRHAGNTSIFLAACDMPGINPDIVVYLASFAGRFDVVVPHVDGCYEPLHAIYSKRCIGPVEKMIADDDRMILHLYDSVATRRVGMDELKGFKDFRSFYTNINYKSDIQ